MGYSICWCSKRHCCRWESGTQTKKDENLSGEPKETAISREIMPADGSSPAQRMNGDFRHVPAYDRQTWGDSLSLTDGRSKEKELLSAFQCRLPLLRCTIFLQVRSSSNCC